jgi:hypothetical protein
MASFIWSHWLRSLVLLTVVLTGTTVLLLTGRGSPSPPGVSAQFVPRQMIEGPYWTVQSGFESSLMVSNTPKEKGKRKKEKGEQQEQWISEPFAFYLLPFAFHFIPACATGSVNKK